MYFSAWASSFLNNWRIVKLVCPHKEGIWGYYKTVIDHGRLLRPTYNIFLSLAVPLIGSLNSD
jgi:hypothetical protein